MSPGLPGARQVWYRCLGQHHSRNGALVLHRVTVGRVTIRRPHPHFGCEHVYGIGWSWVCRCGGRGQIYGSREVAKENGVLHVEAHATSTVQPQPSGR